MVVKAWTKKFGLANKAKFIFGVSSGASFAVKFPMTMWVDGVISGEWGQSTAPQNSLSRRPALLSPWPLLTRRRPMCLFAYPQRSTCRGRSSGARPTAVAT